MKIKNLEEKIQELKNEKSNKIISNSKEMQLNTNHKDILNENQKLKKRIIELETLVNNRNNNNYNFINDNKELQQLYAKLVEKEKEIEQLNNKLIGSIKYDDLKNGEKLIAVNFISGDQRINFPIVCKASSLFAEVENILYLKYPEYEIDAEEDNLFLANGKKMKRIKTMADNGFPGYSITLMKSNN